VIATKKARRHREGTPLSVEDYAGFFLADVTLEELLLFAARICARVVDYRITGDLASKGDDKHLMASKPNSGYRGSFKNISSKQITNPLLVKAIEGLDTAMFKSKQSKNAGPGMPRLKPAWDQVKALHDRHRSEYSKRAPFIRFAMVEVIDCPSFKTVDGWVKILDNLSAG
jgi:hypothetical protein